MEYGIGYARHSLVIEHESESNRRSGNCPERWHEISVEVPREYAEPITHLFAKHGDGRVFVGETGDWDADDASHAEQSAVVTVKGYLRIDDTLEYRSNMIDVGVRLIGQLTDIGELTTREVTSEEWSHQEFPITRVAGRLVIASTEMDDAEAETGDGDIRISLAPGLAFGTGTHPTTRMCLEQLVVESRSGNLARAVVLDVGCGSGILTIAALKLGAGTASCLDIDETARRATRMNLMASGVADRASVLSSGFPSDEVGGHRFGYVLANITSKVLEDIGGELCDRLTDGGVMLISGILADSAFETLVAFESRGMKMTDRRADGDWVMFRLVRSEV